jgi:hypothetical protein
MEWDYATEERIPVDAWESLRRERPRRHGDELRTDWLHRTKLLKGEVSDKEIAAATEELYKFQRQRMQTIHRMKFEKIETFTESLCRKAKRAQTIRLPWRNRDKVSKKGTERSISNEKSRIRLQTPV